ncbi:hypothetical protein E4S40_05205 [Algoriphagus kandeliae]|uniref:Uncharacterized protein n=1 Tax=Algoriphagus kandeliae TaxID=2562278 RepID=A0A4Y9QT47_9BACT|nr:hypothetical protein [Algoriphagus kandeliae]TFV95619.1 hypothetical protein E4S40_05205 [Algoriphagus kandeliae]
MKKLIPILIDNKYWIQLSQLQSEQAKKLKSWLPSGSLKNLTYQGILLKDCLQFETYEYWFRNQGLRNQRQEHLDF